MADARAPDWWLRLGGPNAISIPAWLLTLPGGVAASFAWLPKAAQVDLPVMIGLSLASHVLTGAVLYPAWRTYLSPRPRPSRPWALVATLLLAGAVRGAFLAQATAAAGIVTTAPVLGRALGTSVAVLVWFSLAALIVDATRRHREQMAGLRRELARAQGLAEGSARLVRDFRAEQVAQARTLVAEQIEIASTLDADPRRTAAHLRQTAEEVVRPFSHALEQRTRVDALILSDTERLVPRPRPPLRDYAVGVVTDRPFSPLVTAVVLVATPLVVTLTVLGPVLGAVMLFTSGSALFAALSWARRSVAPALPRLDVPVRAILVLTVWCLCTALAALLLVAVARVAAADPDSWLTSLSLDAVQSTLIVSVAMASITMLAAAVEGAVEGQRRRTESNLHVATQATQWAQSRLRQQMWSEQRRLGRILHGDVQSRLLATALRLAEPSAPPASDMIATLARDVQAALDLDDERGLRWRPALDDIRDLWQLAAALTIRVDPAAAAALDQDPAAGDAVTAVVGEAVMNAVRHGQAQAITVDVRPAPRAVEVTVTDDGRIPPADTSGQGSRILDAVCLDWSLSRDRPTTLRASIACRAPDAARRGAVA